MRHNRKLFKLVVFCWIVVATPVAAKSVEDVVERWQHDFQRTQSLTVHSSFAVEDRTYPTPKIAKWSHKLTLNGEKYLSEIVLPEGSKPSTAFIAFNESQWQKLSVRGTSVTLEKGTLTEDFFNPYFGTHPIISLFQFALSANDILSLATLQSPETWTKFMQKVTKVEDGSRKGRQGTLLTVEIRKMEKDSMVCEVFVDESTNIPLFWKTMLSKQPQHIITETEVGEVKEWSNDGASYAFPLLIKSSTFVAKRTHPDLVSTWQVDAAMLRVNGPVPVDIFTLPATQATHVVDLDAVQKKARESRQNKEKKELEREANAEEK